MMRHAELLVHLEGPLLVGGYASALGDLDATTAADEHGVPFVPASTLKGALREACTALARVDGDDRACTIDVACPRGCLVCELFGRPGSDADDVLADKAVKPGVLGGLYLGDARPDVRASSIEADVLRRSLRTRPGVGIDRHTRAATPQVFYEREVLDAPGHALVAPLRADVEPDAWDLFLRALRLVRGIGNSRSRGFGRVRLELRELSAGASAAHVLPDRAPEHGAAIVEIEALEPLFLGGLPSTSSLAHTASFITGAALRGALATAAARLDMAAFKQVFVEPDQCLLFSDAYPIARAGAGLPVPVPRSSLSCKHEKRADHHGAALVPRDGLLALALTPWLRRQHGGGLEVPRCAACKSPLRSARGLWPTADPVRRVITRLGRDIATGSAMPELLYTTTPFEPGTRFAGTLGRLTPDALSLLRAVAREEVRIGRGRRRGQGLVRITVREDRAALGPKAVERRLAAYAAHVRDALPLLGEAAGLARPGAAIAVLARTDLTGPTEEALDRIRTAVYGDAAPRARCVASAQATAARSGWSDGHEKGQRAGPRALAPVILAGSAWLFVHEEGVKPDLARLSALEIEGIAGPKELGLGRLAIAHELFREAALSPQEGV